MVFWFILKSVSFRIQVILCFYFVLEPKNYEASLAYSLGSGPYHAKRIAMCMSFPALGSI